MTAQESGLQGIAHAIQLAVAPVFLVSGVGALLAVGRRDDPVPELARIEAATES